MAARVYVNNYLGRDLVDTANPHHKGQLGVSSNVVVAFFLSIALQPEYIKLNIDGTLKKRGFM